MMNRGLKTQNNRNPLVSRWRIFLPAAFLILISLGVTGCPKKAAPRSAVSGPVRVVLLPFAVPEKDKDIQWTAMAAPALMAKISRQLPEMAIVPLYESMPSAIASAGAARSFTDETAISLANWVGAKWAVMGEISRTKSSYSLVIDFIPTSSMDVPFRYIKTKKLDSMGTAFQTATRQWLRYVTGKPVPVMRSKESGLNKMRVIAEALDQEYGWLVTAKTDNAREAIGSFSASDYDWIRLLLNPAQYAVLEKTGN